MKLIKKDKMKAETGRRNKIAPPPHTRPVPAPHAPARDAPRD